MNLNPSSRRFYKTRRKEEIYIKAKHTLKVLTAGVILAVGVFIANPSTSEAKSFTDLPKSGSHAEAVNYLNKLDVYDYKSGNQLKGNSAVTRGEVSKIIYTLGEGQLPKVRSYKNDFKDINNYSYAKEVIWSYEVGIFDGGDGQKFNPTSRLTRAQMSKILVYTFDLKSKGKVSFKDLKSDHWANDYVSILGSNKITTGDGKGNYLPNNNVTLNQLSSFIYRIAVEQEKEESKKPVTQVIQEMEQAVIDLTNEERKKAGLEPLQADTQLMGLARQKSEDMTINKYFSHISPVYGSPFDQMEANGIDYYAAAENIAVGQSSAGSVVRNWMDSPGHKQNILYPDFTHIGVGYDPIGRHWTQQFIYKMVVSSQEIPGYTFMVDK